MSNSADDAINDEESWSSFDKDISKGDSGVTKRPRKVVVNGLNRPLFHIDLTSALQSAIANVDRLLTLRVALGLDNFHRLIVMELCRLYLSLVCMYRFRSVRLS